MKLYARAGQALIMAVFVHLYGELARIQYSRQDTTRNALFLMTSRVERLVGKTAVDTVAVRKGAIMSAIIVYFGSARGWSNSTFAIINVVLASVWLAFVMLIGRELARRADETAEELAREPRRDAPMAIPLPSKARS